MTDLAINGRSNAEQIEDAVNKAFEQVMGATGALKRALTGQAQPALEQPAEEQDAQDVEEELSVAQDPDRLLTEEDTYYQGLIATELESFRSWLGEYNLYSKSGTNVGLLKTLRWLKFQDFFTEVGYLPEKIVVGRNEALRNGVSLALGDTQPVRKREVPPVMSYLKSDFDLQPDNKRNQYNLFKLLDMYLKRAVPEDDAKLEPADSGRENLFAKWRDEVTAIAALPADAEFSVSTYGNPVLETEEKLEIPSFLQEKKEPFSFPDNQPPSSVFGRKQAKWKTVLPTLGIAVRSAAVSAAVTSVSRIAIVAGLGTFGIGAVPAGIAAGLAIGGYKAWKNYKQGGNSLQFKFGVASTAAGAVLGAVGMDWLIDPVADFFADRSDLVGQIGALVQEKLELVKEVASLKSQLVTDRIDAAFNGVTNTGTVMAADLALLNVPEIDFDQAFAVAEAKDAGTALNAINEVAPIRMANATGLYDGISFFTGAGSTGHLGMNIVPDANIDIDVEADAASVPDIGADAPEFKTYTVQRGDTLSQLVAAQTGLRGEDLYRIMPQIMNANPELGGNAHRIFVGQEIKIPASFDGAGVEASAPAFTTYAVSRGDNLSDIITEQYGLRGEARHEAMLKVIAANPDIARNPADLTIGQQLKLPADLDNAPSADCNETRLRRGRSNACMVPSIG